MTVVLAPRAQIRAALLAVGKPPPEQLEDLIVRGRRLRLERGEAFIRQGESSHRMGFVHSGIIRYHVHAVDSGRDFTKDFEFAGSFVVSYSGAILGQPARESVTAVEECELTVWPWSEFAEAFTRDIEWERMRRRFAETLFVEKEDRELAFLLTDAESRYRAALARFPADLERVPQHLLASYLGIAPESLSRLKRKKRAMGLEPVGAPSSVLPVRHPGSGGRRG